MTVSRWKQVGLFLAKAQFLKYQLFGDGGALSIALNS
jgi:hypothetical protein